MMNSVFSLAKRQTDASVSTISTTPYGSSWIFGAVLSLFLMGIDLDHDVRSFEKGTM